MEFLILKNFAHTPGLNISKDQSGDLGIQGKSGQVLP
jgi:hypothetical protein